MFKAPDKHYPREWGQPKVNPWVFYIAVAVAAVVLVGFSVIPFGPELLLILFAIVAAVAVCRNGQ